MLKTQGRHYTIVKARHKILILLSKAVWHDIVSDERMTGQIGTEIMHFC